MPEENLRKCGAWLDQRRVVIPEAFEHFEQLIEQLRHGGHEVRCHEDALEFIAQCRDRRTLAARIERLFPDGMESAAFDELLKVKMYPYQRQGALFTACAGRSLLADDMGLGKTIQALAAAEILAKAAGIERVLIIAPTSLKHQWKQEIEKFTDRDATVIEGLTSARRRAYADPSFFKITNYEVLHRDTDAIEEWAPDLIILDEAQRIKNWKTRAARTVKRLESQHAIVLTGTPLENRLEELHSIVEFVDRFRLGPAFRFLAEHQQSDEHGRVVGYRNLSGIAKTLEPILLRRTKSQVLSELPPRLDKHLFIPMTQEQQAHHDENQEIVARIVMRWKRTGFLSEADQKRLTCALQNMRMVCNSTYLLDPSTDYGHKVDELMAQLSELLEERDAKVVIFSQWLRSHELLAKRLERQRQPYVLFHGGVPGPRRKDLVARFKQEAACRVFLSTDAGGVGLNLQNASAVFNLDQPWNPAVLEQRIGRVHRLGQQQPVNVVHFVAKGSIEQGMLDVLKFKKSLFSGVLDGGQDEVFLGGTRLKKFMESVEAVTERGNQPRSSEPTPAPVRQDADRLGKPADIGSVAPLLEQMIAGAKSLLDGLGRALGGASDNGRASNGDAPRLTVNRDPATGQAFLKIPVPSAEMLGRANVWLSALAGALGAASQANSR